MLCTAITTLNITAIEQGTIIITASFKDEAGNDIIPKTLHWSLTDSKGNIINNRENVAVTPSQSIKVTLSGDDLKISDTSVLGVCIKRFFVLRGTYDSDAGTDLNLVGECSFNVFKPHK